MKSKKYRDFLQLHLMSQLQDIWRGLLGALIRSLLKEGFIPYAGVLAH
jgi:hypothetical protein